MRRPMTKFKNHSRRKPTQIEALRLTPGWQAESQPQASRSGDRSSRIRRRTRSSRERVMQNGLYVAVSGEVALQRRLETIADNIANMNTVGYRATGVSFEVEIARAGDTRLNYVSPGSDYLSRRIGGLVRTDNPLDFAIQGDGWFRI